MPQKVSLQQKTISFTSLNEVVNKAHAKITGQQVPSECSEGAWGACIVGGWVKCPITFSTLELFAWRGWDGSSRWGSRGIWTALRCLGSSCVWSRRCLSQRWPSCRGTPRDRTTGPGTTELTPPRTGPAEANVSTTTMGEMDFVYYEKLFVFIESQLRLKGFHHW